MKKTIKAVFPLTLPVLTGYIFMGIAFGILLQSIGYGFWWAGLMGVFIYAGSMQFVAVGLLTAGFSPLNTIFITLMVNARHIFYGISMLDRFKDIGRAKPYLIFALTDETFSLLHTAKPPEGIREESFLFWIALLNHLYWITGCVAGGVIGTLISFDIKGIDFVMTALFVSIFVEQWRGIFNRIPGLVGLGGSILCLLIFGQENFILPAMALLVGVLSLVREPVEKGFRTE